MKNQQTTKWNLTILLIFLSIFFFGFAFGESYRDGYGLFYEDDVVFTFGDRVNLRDDASLKADVIIQLSAATKLTIIERDEEYLTVNNYMAPWYKVKAEYNGKSYTGHLWGGLIALHHFPFEAEKFQKSDQKILFGIIGKTQSSYQGEIREFITGTEQMKIRKVECPGAGTMMTAMFAEHTDNFDGIDTLLHIGFDEGPCMSFVGGTIVLGIRDNYCSVFLAQGGYQEEWVDETNAKTKDIYHAHSDWVKIGDTYELEKNQFKIERDRHIYVPVDANEWVPVGKRIDTYQWDGKEIKMIASVEAEPEI